MQTKMQKKMPKKQKKKKKFFGGLLGSGGVSPWQGRVSLVGGVSLAGGSLGGSSRGV